MKIIGGLQRNLGDELKLYLGCTGSTSFIILFRCFQGLHYFRPSHMITPRSTDRSTTDGERQPRRVVGVGVGWRRNRVSFGAL